MKTFVAGTDVTLSVTFLRNGQPAIPTAGSAIWSLLDPTGTEMATGDLTLGPVDFTASVPIPAAHNTVTGSFSKRTLVARAMSAGWVVEHIESYRLLPEIVYTVQARDVRSYLGVNERELPDADIDVAKAFLEIQADVGALPLYGALTSGEMAEIKANDAILYRSALNVLPSLQNRVANKESDGQLSFQRNTQKDFSALAALTETRLSAALSLVVTRSDVSYSLLITTNDADPVTG